MSVNYGLTREQKQLLSQSRIQSLKLLNMCNTELNSFLNNEYQENPLFDHKEGNGEPGMVEEFDSWYRQSQSFNEGYGSDDKEESHGREKAAFENRATLNSYLKEQLDAKKYSKEDWNLIDFLIMNLEDDGLYTTSAEDTAKLAHASVDMVKKCLEDLRQLEPTGIFAKNLSSCLLRQLEELGVEDEKLKDIISCHLEDALHGKISSITRHLKISSVQVKKYIAFIGTLNPRPLSGFSSGNNSYLVPDILFARKGDSWEITLNDDWMGEYSLNEYYLQMIAESEDAELQKYFREKLERARFILDSVEQRRKTILSISYAVLDWQRSFFEEHKALVPMTLDEIAAKLEIQSDTVSGAVNGKYIQYPGGTILMNNLFGASSTDAAKDGSITARQIKEVLKNLIDSEDKRKPYSDQVLMNLAKNQGISLSRRSIAKYREEMGIPGSFQRKEKAD